MGLLNAGMLGGFGAGAGGGMSGLLPMLMQQQGPKPGEGITPKPDPSFMGQLANGLSSPQFQNGLQMMETGQPPQMPQNSSGMPNAFSGNPQFMQQLQGLMSQQGPGAQGPRMTPPPAQVSTQPPTATNGRTQSVGAPRLNNYLIGRPFG